MASKSNDTAVLLRYVAAILVGAAMAAGSVLYAQLSGGKPVDAVPILTAALGALLTGLQTMLLPALKGGKEQP